MPRRGGADLLAAGGVLGGELDHAVVREDDLRAVGDEELLASTVDAERRASLSDFLQEGEGVEHDAVADDGLACLGAECRRG